MHIDADLSVLAQQFVSRLVKPTSRTHWIYLLSALAMATALFVARRGEYPRISLRGFLFPRSVWWHRSARVDYLFVAITMPIWALLAAPHLLSSFTVASRTTAAIGDWIGAWHEGSAPDWSVTVAYTIALLLAADFAAYWAHRWLHRSAVLWEFHKVHHSAEVLTPVTVYRVHPVEHLIQTVMGALSLGLITGVFLWMFPRDLTPITVLGVNVGRFAFYLIGVNLRHSHIWLSFGRRLEHVFMSPAQHHIHHSNDPRHFDRNFGSEFSIWDWVFGSLYVTGARSEVKGFGLGEVENRRLSDPVQLHVAPFIAAARIVFKSRAPLITTTSPRA